MIEIERRFLVDGTELPSLRQQAVRCYAIEQFYLTADPERVVRLRARIDKTPQESLKQHGLERQPAEAFITIKGPKINGVGTEIEAPIKLEEFEMLKDMKIGKLIAKERLEIPGTSGTTTEVDIFSFALVIAEVEFKTEAEAQEFSPYEWMGPEITDDPSYSNQRLALSQ